MDRDPERAASAARLRGSAAVAELRVSVRLSLPMELRELRMLSEFSGRMVRGVTGITAVRSLLLDLVGFEAEGRELRSGCIERSGDDLLPSEPRVATGGGPCPVVCFDSSGRSLVLKPGVCRIDCEPLSDKSAFFKGLGDLVKADFESPFALSELRSTGRSPNGSGPLFVRGDVPAAEGKSFRRDALF